MHVYSVHVMMSDDEIFNVFQRILTNFALGENSANFNEFNNGYMNVRNNYVVQTQIDNSTFS